MIMSVDVQIQCDRVANGAVYASFSIASAFDTRPELEVQSLQLMRIANHENRIDAVCDAEES